MKPQIMVFLIFWGYAIFGSIEGIYLFIKKLISPGLEQDGERTIFRRRKRDSV